VSRLRAAWEWWRPHPVARFLYFLWFYGVAYPVWTVWQVLKDPYRAMIVVAVVGVGMSVVLAVVTR